MKDQDFGQKIRISDEKSGFRIKDQDSASEVANFRVCLVNEEPYPPMCDISTFSMGVASARISE
jgi:hypothetical protein